MSNKKNGKKEKARTSGRLHSLQFKSFRAIIGAFVGALLVFTVTEMIGTFFIENIIFPRKDPVKGLKTFWRISALL